MTAGSRFPTYSRGQYRDLVLAAWRADLRNYTNPETNAVFTEREIATATAPGSRWYSEADALDLALMQGQRRSVWLAQQAHEDTASAQWLKEYHGPRRGLSPLAAVGGSGQVEAIGVPGITYVGSTTLGAASAARARDDDGRVYQVLSTTSIPASQYTVTLTMRAIDTGIETNLAVDSTLTWIENAPAGSKSTAKVTQLFTGGYPQESMSDFARRISDDRRNRAGSANWSHFRAWAREASVAVQDAFVYPCAKYAGFVLICVLQKRPKGTLGPTGRLAASGVLTDVTTAIVPPGSTNVPAHPLVLVVDHVAETTNMTITLSMPYASQAGWKDVDPWPHQNAGTATTVTNVTDQQNLQITIPSGSATPSASAPSLMFWHEDTSRFIPMAVSNVALDSGQIYDVTLSSEPSQTIAVGDYVCPDTNRRDFINEAVNAYFDHLGPGEVVTLGVDPRAHRAYRHPKPSFQWPSEAGAAIIDWLGEALGSAMTDGTLVANSNPTPGRPTDPSDGPSLIVPGNIGVYPT